MISGYMHLCQLGVHWDLSIRFSSNSRDLATFALSRSNFELRVCNFAGEETPLSEQVFGLILVFWYSNMSDILFTKIN